MTIAGTSAVAPIIASLEVRTPSLAQTVGNLSGGNQQKISLAKWLAAGVRILIVDEPSVGIDIKTKAYIHELLRRLSDEGTAILLITSDMPEMISMGRVMKEPPPANAFCSPAQMPAIKMSPINMHIPVCGATGPALPGPPLPLQAQRCS